MKAALFASRTRLPVRPLVSSSFVTRMATWISHIFCPPLVGLATLLLIGGMVASPAGWLWVAVFCLATLALPTLYIYWLVRQGQVSDFHVPIQSERIRPLSFTLLTAIVAGLLAWWWAAPDLLRIIGFVNIGQALALLIITLRWKISLHCLAVAELVTLCLYLMGMQALALLLFVPLVAWARVYLRRHTLGQTVAGTAMGALLIWLVMQYST